MLNERQKAFADHYIECGNASEAARRAGYKAENADVTGPRLLGNVGISSYIDERLKAASEKRIASADEVLEFFSAVMRGEVKDQFGLETSVDTRISAGKELMKRYNAAKNSDGRVDKVAEIMAKLDEEARADVER
jgi:phage terminase small subunit